MSKLKPQPRCTEHAVKGEFLQGFFAPCLARPLTELGILKKLSTAFGQCPSNPHLPR